MAYLRRSLKTRITLATLTIFVASIWSLALYASHMLKQDMQRLLSDQQLSTASFMAAEINEEVNDRVKALETYAAGVSPAMLGNKPALQDFLEDRLFLRKMFGGGLMVIGIDGSALADVPVAAGRIGVNYADSDHVAAALKEGKTTIGRPAVGKKLHTPAFSIVVPVRDGQRQVIGALVGVTDLSKPNFLDKLTQYHYGKTGGYLLIASKDRLIITATDKSRIMTRLPEAGINPQMDRFIQGYEGSAVYVNSVGVEILTSVNRVPVAGWHLAASLPTKEAFAPIHAMQLRMVVATILLTLLAAGLTWAMLRRQLAPMLAAAEMLAARSDGQPSQRALPIVSQDEIGELVGGFNRLLATLAQRENALKESEFRWKFALEGAGNGVWDVDLATREILHSKRDREILEYAEGEFKKDPGEWLQHIHADDKPRVREAVEAYREGRSRVFDIEYRLRGKDGNYKWIAARGKAVSFGKDGKPLRIIGTHSDITERKHAEKALAESEERFIQFMNALPAVAFIKDEAGTFIFLNRYMEQHCGAGAWRGKSARDLFPPRIAARVIAEDRHALDAGHLIAENTAPDASGQHRLFQMHKFAMTRQGKPPLLGGIALDITDHKKAEGEMLAAKVQAEKANNAKSRFLAAASHDLRQPLAALSLYIGALNRHGSPRDHDLIMNIESCVASLSELLTDILDVSKLDAGVVTPMISSFSIDQLLAEIISVQSVEAGLKGLQLRWRDSGAIAHSDRRWISRILNNLISNAIRYTDKGAVLVACRRHQGKLWVEVWDSGRGIPADKTEVIFDEFTQLANDARNRGSGLGLSIVAKTAALLGLQIRLRSRLGRGSMLAIELPLGIAVVPDTSPTRIVGQRRPLRIGLVDDNVNVLKALCMVLERNGHEVVAAAAGHRLLESLGEKEPDIVIADFRLENGETGFDVIEAARFRFGKDLPAIVITGDTDPALVRSMADRGIAVHYKPLNTEALLAFITDATEPRIVSVLIPPGRTSAAPP